MKVGILGPLVVVDDARSIEVRGARLRALLIRLAANAGSWVSVGQLVEALWSDGDLPEDEKNALQSLVSRLRRSLGVADVIESGPAGYRLAVIPEAVDAIRFERLTARGRRSLQDGDAAEAWAVLEEALGLWRGETLGEVAEAEYAMTWAARLAEVRLAALENHAAAGLLLGRHAELVAALEETTQQNPLRERSHELLIRALAGSGRQTEALAVYERLSRRLGREQGLDPPIRLQQLRTAVLRSAPDLRQAEDQLSTRTSTSAPRRTNLRAPLTSFIGRSDEVAQIVGLLHLGSRLVTLVGTGGAGKTRLAGEFATQDSTVGPGGVWMIELAPVTDPQDVASTVLGSIGNQDLQIMDRPAPTRDVRSRLLETLADRDVVLILDNCEHVLDAAAKLAEFLLGRCPRLKILATSREPLGIVGESLCSVLPLATPEPGAADRAVLNTPAVRLFIDRAAMVRPGFAVTAANTAAVTEICRRLDGLPLAIELAAARLRNLTVEAVSARLNNRFRLLSGGNRTAMARHQTLRAVVAWSWQLLTDSEQILIERLSVFPGGATAETAEAVCVGGAVLPEDAVGDLLMSLADKSLLVVVEPTNVDAGTEPRYRMLETVREYAAQRLDERGEAAALRAAHARCFLDLAEAAEPRLRTAEQLVWLDRLSTERDNLLAALRFAVETEDADTAIRLAAALSWYWNLTGRLDEGTKWLEQVLTVPGDPPQEAYTIAVVIYTIAGVISGLRMADPSQVQHILELVGAFEVDQRHPLLALVEPAVAMVSDNGEQAMTVLNRNLAHPDLWARSMLHLMSAMHAENNGDTATLQEQLPLALDGFRANGDRWGIGNTVGALATLHSSQGRDEDAITALYEARELMIELGAADDESATLARIATLRLRLGDAKQARRDVESALEIAAGTGSSTSIGLGTFGLAMLANHEGRPAEARRLALEALVLIDQAPFAPPQIKASIYCGLATFDIAAGDLDDAAERLAQARAAVEVTADMPIAANVTTGVADLLLARGDAAAAAEMLGAAISLRGRRISATRTCGGWRAPSGPRWAPNGTPATTRPAGTDRANRSGP